MKPEIRTYEQYSVYVENRSDFPFTYPWYEMWEHIQDSGLDMERSEMHVQQDYHSGCDEVVLYVFDFEGKTLFKARRRTKERALAYADVLDYLGDVNEVRKIVMDYHYYHDWCKAALNKHEKRFFHMSRHAYLFICELVELLQDMDVFTWKKMVRDDQIRTRDAEFWFEEDLIFRRIIYRGSPCYPGVAINTIPYEERIKLYKDDYDTIMKVKGLRRKAAA